ncbi:MAG: hypothetical protein UR69_C0003G0133 [Candidatus Moranbacteria bacterium GW2011_GWE2_35_2-]|nr:MAG: hypothetical protein UR69_C0003G0133 [Candidatus Moranbacteria bacterium GW2011_GWE2_35_2-]KKQ06153.1 MAG: hypothetical protein US15_C0017G0005 [Candidatus Moranbacteria bacterium GW2011_GWF1_36_4]KKQ21975.1 MAG: hypothetical protein US37_C0005G0017 [Candidatus Moranbacteria bacterium GW2011_GWF2_37_11]KKQ29096.1 MAG: hypothetical protein US44_C0003G0008 [Candidatus Moranbacteria bacterium GW2011_GWD1_37_17]KKQ31081.1 MAG: hypothetical protein US47_C0001G0314 [Candidatus Moranbacteria b
MILADKFFFVNTKNLSRTSLSVYLSAKTMYILNMENQRKNILATSDYKIYSRFFLFWLGLGFLAFTLSLSGLFYEYIFEAYFIFGISYLLRSIRKKRFRISKEMIIIYLAIAIIAIAVSFFSTPTVFSGRDQGSISEAAIRLAQNHQLEFSTPASQEFFKIYGPGKALNFPGFHYTENGTLITQFPLVYIGWLAVFFSIFGLGLLGLIIANAILFFLFACSFYLLLRIFVAKKCATFGILLLLTSFSFFWIAKFTLTENIALTLLWFSILNLVLFLQKPAKSSYWYFFLSSSLLIFARIEGVAFFVFSFIAIFFSLQAREYIKKNISSFAIIPLIILAVIFVINFHANLGFYKEISKAIFGSTQNTIVNLDTETNLLEKYIYPALYSLKIYFLYGLLGFFIAGIVGIFYFLKKKKYLILMPLLITSPSFIYLIDSNISSDHPWMLRRFAFSILPIFIFYSILFLSKLHLHFRKNIRLLAIIIFFLLLAGNLPAFVRHLDFSENNKLLEQIKKISQNFSSNDLILIDRLASGDGWAMISGPMNFIFEKNSVYFFNPQDFDKLNLEKFDRIYLIAPDKNIAFYQNSPIESRMHFLKNYSLQTHRLENNEDDENLELKFASKKYEIVSGVIFEIEK